MFVRAERRDDGLDVFNPWGHRLILPAVPRGRGDDVALATLGTMISANAKGGKTRLMAEMLAALGHSIYLLDVGRSGVGSHGSWSPREFASVIADIVGARHTSPSCTCRCSHPAWNCGKTTAREGSAPARPSATITSARSRRRR